MSCFNGIKEVEWTLLEELRSTIALRFLIRIEVPWAGSDTDVSICSSSAVAPEATPYLCSSVMTQEAVAVTGTLLLRVL